MSAPDFASVGSETGKIDVHLSYKIIELFSEGLYTSPNKAVEELVANSFDAGARRVQVLLPSSFNDPDAAIVVFDDGEGMGIDGLTRHWRIGFSNKRELPQSELPRGRSQIGKFGIGKLATYVLAERLTHISQYQGKYYSTSMDYGAIVQNHGQGIEFQETPIQIPLRELSPAQAEQAIRQWTESSEFKTAGISLFGKGSPSSWTVSIMSSLKDKAHEIKRGHLEWVLRTALPLRDDFKVWLNGRQLTPSKESKKPLLHWQLGKGLVKLHRPGPKDIKVTKNPPGLDIPGLGRVWGYAEAYKDLLTGGKSDEIGRSHGFFVYVRGRLLNVSDGHFGISPDELRHGTFGRFRLVIHIDKLDDGLRSNRETIEDGPLLEATQNVLRAIFNAVRPKIEAHDLGEEPGAKLSRRIAASPAGLSRTPIVTLCRAVMEGKSEARYLIVPEYDSVKKKKEFLASLEKRARKAEHFVADVDIDFSGESRDAIVKFDTVSGTLLLNGFHPFISVFHDAFSDKKVREPLELMMMAEVLSEAQLHVQGIERTTIDAFLSERDQLLRSLANESGRQSAVSIAQALSEARNDPVQLEQCVNAAFRSLGFEVSSYGKPNEPDGVASAYLSPSAGGELQHYRVSLEAKSKQAPAVKVSAHSVNISAIARNRDEFKCDHAVIVGPAFPTARGENSALAKEIRIDREKHAGSEKPRTITLINIDDLAKLVRLCPVKQIGLKKLRELFQECSLPEESARWVKKIEGMNVEQPPYREILKTIAQLQKEFSGERVSYAALRVALRHLPNPVKYEVDADLADVCTAMSQLAPRAIHADREKVELDQSVDNVMTALKKALHDSLANE